MKKLIRNIRFNYYWTMAEKAMKNNDVENFRKHSALLRKMLWE